MVQDVSPTGFQPQIRMVACNNFITAHSLKHESICGPMTLYSSATILKTVCETCKHLPQQPPRWITLNHLSTYIYIHTHIYNYIYMLTYGCKKNPTLLWSFESNKNMDGKIFPRRFQHPTWTRRALKVLKQQLHGVSLCQLQRLGLAQNGDQISGIFSNHSLTIH